MHTTLAIIRRFERDPDLRTAATRLIRRAVRTTRAARAGVARLDKNRIPLDLVASVGSPELALHVFAHVAAHGLTFDNFALWCARRVQALMPDPTAQAVLDYLPVALSSWGDVDALHRRAREVKAAHADAFAAPTPTLRVLTYATLQRPPLAASLAGLQMTRLGRQPHRAVCRETVRVLNDLARDVNPYPPIRT